MFVHGAGMTRGRFPRSLVAGGGVDQDPRRVGVEECQLDRVGVRVRPTADREVDHVDLVDDRAVHGGDAVGSEAPLVEAHAVADHVRARRHAARGPAVDPPHLGRVDEVAGGRRERVRSVAVGVTRRADPRSRCGVGVGAVLAVLGAEDGRVGVGEGVGADHLVVARERRVVRITGETELTAVRTCGRARQAPVLEHRILGPDARVQVRHDHALAREVGAVELVPDRLGTDRLIRLLHGGRLVERVTLDGDDARDPEQRADLVRRQTEAEPSVREAEHRTDGGARDLGVDLVEGRPLDLRQVRAVGGHRPRVVVDRPTGDGGTRGLEVADPARVGADRVVVELHDDVDQSRARPVEERGVCLGELAGDGLGCVERVDLRHAAVDDTQVVRAGRCTCSRRRYDDGQHDGQRERCGETSVPHEQTPSGLGVP